MSRLQQFKAPHQLSVRKRNIFVHPLNDLLIEADTRNGILLQWHMWFADPSQDHMLPWQVEGGRAVGEGKAPVDLSCSLKKALNYSSLSGHYFRGGWAGKMLLNWD